VARCAFVDELAARVRRAGATGEILLRGDSGFWSYKTIRVELAKVIDLRSSVTQQELRLSVGDLTTDDLTMTQALGAAAHALDFEGIVAPLATSIGDVLAVFPERIRISGVLEVVERRMP
jgi:hypothetical protein